MSEQSRVISGALVGALTGAAAAYLFFTERGAVLRERMEPAVDDLQREFAKLRRTVEKLGSMANEGMRAYHEFNAARMQSSFGSDRTSH